MKGTRWRPDTCGCQFDVEFDYDLPIGPQSPVVVASSLCPQHVGLMGMNHANRFLHVNGQNVRKNDALIETYMELGLVEDSTVMARLMDQYVENIYLTGQDEDRVIHLVMKNMTQGRKNGLQRRLDNKYGSGRVVIE